MANSLSRTCYFKSGDKYRTGGVKRGVKNQVNEIKISLTLTNKPGLLLNF
jgi:hypothetical protein